MSENKIAMLILIFFGIISLGFLIIEICQLDNLLLL
jgi:hypothetical protein